LFTPKIPFIGDGKDERRKIGGRNDIEMRKAKEDYDNLYYIYRHSTTN
jgi:hypothetical protein